MPVNCTKHASAGGALRRAEGLPKGNHMKIEGREDSLVSPKDLHVFILHVDIELDLDDLSGIHAIVRVERAFEVAHHTDAGAVLGLEKRHLARADAVFTC